MNITELMQHSNYSSYEELELLSSNWQIVLIAVYSLTASLALVGNVLTICVLINGKNDRPNKSNELNIFLLNLSFADVTMALFSIPFTYTHFMLGRWIFNPEFCPIVQLMQITSVFVSVYTLTAIGIDRCIAIMYPFMSAQFSYTFAYYAIGFIWLAGITLGSVQWSKTQGVPFYIANELNYDCNELWSRDQSKWFTLSIFVITFALPMCILSFTYGSMGVKLYHHYAPGNADLARDRAQHRAKVKIIKMLATLVVMFALCWLPLHMLNLIINFAHDWLTAFYDTPLGFNSYVTIVIIAHWLSMANSFVNPIVYCFMCEHFRADLRILLRKCLRSFYNVTHGQKNMNMPPTSRRRSAACRQVVPLVTISHSTSIITTSSTSSSGNSNNLAIHY